MKKKKLNSKGFVLVETLVVTVFVFTIMAVLFNNFYPLMGEYEKREVFDDIDGKYATYWIKRVIQHDKTDIGDCFSKVESEADGYMCKFSCEMAKETSIKNMCYKLIEKTQIKMEDGEPEIYITTYNLEKFKKYVDQHGGISGGMQRYLWYLPDYKLESLNNAKYRVIVEFERTIDEDNYLAYATFEVKK